MPDFRSRFRPNFFLFFFLLPIVASAQFSATLPKDYFIWPVNLRPEIVANMGELRNNHWHMGLDIRTASTENKTVLAAAKGYIAHIGVRSSSFGRFIVVNHPNGLSTLYAHLNDFFPLLEAFVRKEQYKQQSWEIELDFTPNQFPVAQGSFIALSGNTGGSQGPHLHFEIFDTQSEKRLNPMLFNFPLIDDVSPTISQLVMYNREVSTYPGERLFFSVKKSKTGDYELAQKKGIITGLPKISFGIKAFDRINGSQNQDGIYAAMVYLDDSLVSQFVLDSISYSETRAMNAHIDFPHKQRGGSYLQHLSKLPGIEGESVYKAKGGSGEIIFTDTFPHALRIEVWDARYNVSNLEFKIQFFDSLSLIRQPRVFANLVIPAQVFTLEKENFYAQFPPFSFYDSVGLSYFKTPAKTYYGQSDVHTLGDENIPIEKKFRVSIKLNTPVSAEIADRLVIKRTYGRNEEVVKAVKDTHGYAAFFNKLGSFQLLIDTIPPNVNDLGAKDTVNVSKQKSLIFTPTDNNGEISMFKAELDGQWLRFTNDKGRRHIYHFDEHWPDGVHTFKITVRDEAGNTRVKEWVTERNVPLPAPNMTELKDETLQNIKN